MSKPRRKVRLDEAVVERGLAKSLDRARAVILAGEVRLPGYKGRGRPQAGTLIPANQEIELAPVSRYVSRGGEKLAHALRRFEIDPGGMSAVDIGASTGGFTDCLLQAGANRVYAVDAGRGQLHDRLLRDDRVVNMERTNARLPFNLPEKVDIAVVDVSFISLALVLPSIFGHIAPDGRAVALFKPQFEARKDEVPRGGVVIDLGIRALALGRFVRWVTDRGIRIRGLTASPITGAEGNREFFLLLEPPAKHTLNA